MLPKYLEQKIKEIIACCTKDTVTAVENIQNAIDPTNENFILRRPNDEAFRSGTVGVHDLPTNATPVRTGQFLSTKEVFESFYEIDVTATSPASLASGIGKVVSASLVFVKSTGEQYVLNGGNATLAGLCDAYVYCDASGALKCAWSTTHASGDKVRIYVKHTMA